MHFEPLFPNGLGDRRVLHEHFHARLHVELGHALDLGSLVLDRVEFLLIQVARHLQGADPDVEHAADGSVSERCLGAAAGRVPAQHNMLDVQMVNGILNDRQGVDVVRLDDVGDVAVDKHIAGLQAEDGRLGAPRVGAA